MSTVCPHCGKEIDIEEHIFSREELKKMPIDEYKKNRTKLLEQMSMGLIK